MSGKGSTVLLKMLAAFALAAAPLLAVAAPLDAEHQAVLTAMDAQKIDDGCSRADAQQAAGGADIKRLGSVSGHEVILAGVHGSCLCGNINCPFFVVQLDGASPAVLFNTIAIDVKPFGAADPLPKLRSQAHDSALIAIETVAAYNGGKYVNTGSWRVRGDTGERKPLDVPIRFATGASSAQLHGAISIDWGDSYSFEAQQGQHVTIDSVVSSKPLTLSFYPAETGVYVELHPGVAVALPKTGKYSLLIDNVSDKAATYSLRFSIR